MHTHCEREKEKYGDIIVANTESHVQVFVIVAVESLFDISKSLFGTKLFSIKN